MPVSLLIQALRPGMLSSPVLVGEVIMAGQVLYSGDLSLEALERSLKLSEAIHGGLSAIAFQAGNTVASFSDFQVEMARLRLAIDADGPGVAPSGFALLLRGEAAVKGERVRISVFHPVKSGKSSGSAPKR